MSKETKLRAEAIVKPRNYFHGSQNYLLPGTTLKPRLEEYHKDYQKTDFYEILEKFRPKSFLAHRQSVFLCQNDEDLDACGGGTKWVFVLEPFGEITWHDLNWSSEISAQLCPAFTGEKIPLKVCAKNYWAGIPHFNESLWEGLCTRALIIETQKY